MKRIWIMLIVLVLAMLACGKPAPEYMLRGWTVTPSVTVVAQPTQTPYVVQETVVVPQIITNTPEPTKEVFAKCVQADVTVYLRPSANVSAYPITVLENGQKVQDLGGRNGKWWFVSVGDLQGWVDSGYLGDCK